MFEPTKKIKIGESYTLRELLRYSIVYSDNDATALLAMQVGQKYALEVFKDFGIEVPSDNQDYLMRVRTYASFFRVLYNASYISKRHSEEALTLLSEVDFKEGLVAPIPDDIVVAHKFGERESPTLVDHMQIHDCGIVYTKSPYLLCIMAQGTSAKDMLSTISSISKTVYNEISDVSLHPYRDQLSIMQQ